MPTYTTVATCTDSPNATESRIGSAFKGWAATYNMTSSLSFNTLRIPKLAGVAGDVITLEVYKGSFADNPNISSDDSEPVKSINPNKKLTEASIVIEGITGNENMIDVYFELPIEINMANTAVDGTNEYTIVQLAADSGGNAVACCETRGTLANYISPNDESSTSTTAGGAGNSYYWAGALTSGLKRFDPFTTSDHCLAFELFNRPMSLSAPSTIQGLVGGLANPLTGSIT